MRMVSGGGPGPYSESRLRVIRLQGKQESCHIGLITDELHVRRGSAD